MATGFLSAANSAAGVAAAGMKVVNALGSLIRDLREAPASLLVLQSQVNAFSNALENIKEAESKSKFSISKADRLSTQLGNAIGGGFIIIQQLQSDIIEIRSTRPRRKEGREMSLRERLAFKWNDGHIEKWSDMLHRHATVLLLLFESQNRLQEASKSTNSNDNTPPNVYWEDLSQKIAEIDPSYSSASEWAIPGENANFSEYPHADLSTDNRDSVSTTTTESETSGLTKEKHIYSTNELVEKYRQMLLSGTQDLANDCPKFRILLLGKPGVGKSTLASRVLGIPYQRSSNLHGETTAADAIWTPIQTDETNNTLELHDSGGFETDDNLILQHAKDFVDSKRAAKLADQIHAIWYLISCASERPIQKVDRKFFAGKLIDTGEIPVFVVFTKYDRMLRDLADDTGDEPSDEEIEQRADEYFKTHIEAKVKSLIKDPSKFSFCRVGLKKGGDEYIPSRCRNGESFGTKALVEQMAIRLCVADLRILWIVTQQRDDRSKLAESIEYTIRLFWAARGLAKASVLPYICRIGLDQISHEALKLAQAFWNIQNWAGMPADKVRRAVFDLGGFSYLVSQGLLIYNMFGSYSMGIVSDMALNLIVGVNLIGQRLFQMQLRKGRALTKEEINSEVSSFKHSEDRVRMENSISGNITKLTEIDYKAENSESKVLEVARDAVEAALGFVDASFFRNERLKMVNDLGL